jgi:hypothetical protein
LGLGLGFAGGLLLLFGVLGVGLVFVAGNIGPAVVGWIESEVPLASFLASSPGCAACSDM